MHKPTPWMLRRDSSGFLLRWNEDLARQWREAGLWRKETLVDTAQARVDEDPDRLLVVDGEQRLSRGEAWEMARRFAGFLRSRGLGPGDAVAFQLPNWWEAHVVALGLRLAGAVAVPLPPIYREAELRHMLGSTRARLLVLPEHFRRYDHLAMASSLQRELPNLRELLVVRGSGRGNPVFEEAIAAPPADPVPLDPASCFQVMFTSGTTGRAKGVLHTHQAFDYKARQMVEAWGVGPADVIFMPSPVTHVTGAIWAFDIPWIAGARAVLLDVWAPAEALRLIRDEGCTISGGATPFLRELLEVADREPEALASLRLFFCGGTAVPASLIHRVARAFPHCLFFRAYGSTEVMTVTLGIRGPEEAAYGAETDGIVLPPIEVKLLAEDGRVVTVDGEIGEILARGPEQFSGYLDPADNEGAFDEEGFFRTGDLGRWVEGRYLVIAGRKKEIIIRAGENISPKEVEDVLAGHSAVAEVAVVAMPHRRTGETGCAFVVPRPGAVLDLAEMRRFLAAAGLARQKFPEWLELVDNLPRVSSGKVRKEALRERARQIAIREGFVHGEEMK
ncbi:MAG: cyclohexanecarboxylate-CoA ligase [Porticoccaceae bacterium]|nr:MAG: cyclohexanecarboxylate-CoA ligase [Porticoccaceae bacterium]